MKFLFALLMAMAVQRALGQTTTTGNATTSGPCSPAVTGSNNTFNFQYCGKDPEQEKKIIAILNAISESDAKLNAVLQVITPPRIFAAHEAVPTPTGRHPRAAVKFYTDGPDDRGQFEAVCDRACNPVQTCTLFGTNASRLATVSDHPELAEFLFQRQFPSLTFCTVVVESRDDKPVNIVYVRPSRQVENLVFDPAVQPAVSVTTGGTVMQ